MAKRTIPIKTAKSKEAIEPKEADGAVDPKVEAEATVEVITDDAEPEAPEGDAVASSEGTPEAAPESDDAEAAPAPDPTLPFVAEIARLKRALDDKDRTLQKYIAAYKKAEAEFGRSRERLEQDAERRIGQAEGQLTSRFFGVLDDLERSLESGRKSKDADALLSGIEMVYKTFLGRLEDLGVERYEPTGEAFDPDHHEAMGVVPVTDAEHNNRVVQVYQPGFRRGEHNLRPARVLVGKMS